MTASRVARPLIIVAFIAFISLGLPDTLMGVAWPSVRETFDQPIDALGVLLTCAMVGYVSSSFFAGSILRRVGVGALLAGSCAIVTTSLTLYALSPQWPLLFLAALLAGIGAGAIDSGLNAFGAKHFSHRVMNWLHACWGIGATLGPLIMTSVLAAGWAWRYGYGVIAVAMLSLTALFALTLRMWNVDSDAAPEEAHATAPVAHAIRDRRVIAQTLFYFAYGGLENGVGAWLYTLLHHSRGFDVPFAGGVVTAYWASLTIGRIVFGQLAGSIRASTMVRIGIVGATACVPLLLRGMPDWLTCVGAVGIGFLFAPVFPTVMSLTPRRVGERLSPHAVGFQVSAAATGLAIFPALIGIVAQRTSIEILPFAVLGFGVALFLLNEFVERSARAETDERATSATTG